MNWNDKSKNRYVTTWNASHKGYGSYGYHYPKVDKLLPNQFKETKKTKTKIRKLYW